MRSAVQRVSVPGEVILSSCQANRTSVAVTGSPSCHFASRSRNIATRRPSGAAGSSVTTCRPPFSSVGTDSASRGVSSSCASRRTSVSVTAEATKRADGSSSNTVRGSPTRPTTTSRRVGRGVAQPVMKTMTTTSASDIARRGVRSARRDAQRLLDLDWIAVETTAHGKTRLIRSGRGVIRLVESEPKQRDDVTDRRLRAEILLDHRVGGGGRGAGRRRWIARRAHGEERHADHDGDFGKATKETRRAKPWVRRRASRADRQPNATRRDDRPPIPKGRERPTESGYDELAAPWRVVAFDTR